MIDLAKIKKISEWPKARKEIESVVRGILAALPKERADLQAKTVDEVQLPSCTRRRVNYFVDEWDRVTAWLFIPDGKEEAPAILCCHTRVPQGKDEPAGIEGDMRLAFAQHFAELGFVTLAPDCITAGERTSVGLEPYDSSAFYKDRPKMSLIGKMLADHVHAVDLLCETRRVDNARIGVAGHGMGGYNALFLAAFDERVQTCVASCAFTRFADDPHVERWVSDDGFACLPKLEEAVTKREFPFDWEHLLGLSAPSPTLLLTALNDEILDKTRSCEKAVKLARNVYQLLGEDAALCNYEHRAGHSVSDEGLAKAGEWFERWL